MSYSQKASFGAMGVAIVLLTALTASAQDIEVRSSVSQTALWVGAPVTYTVTLSCRPGVEVLQEDLGADKLPLDGLQVVGYALERRQANDGRAEYEIRYQLATFDPGSETVGVRDWVVRYAARTQTPGQTAPAHEVTVPGTPLAWRSALPGTLAGLDLRAAPVTPAAPSWWQSTRSTGLTLLTLSAVLFAAAIAMGMSSGKQRTGVRRIKPASSRDVQSAIAAVAESDVIDPARRRAAYDALDAAVRRLLSGLTTAPLSALTPTEVGTRLAAADAPVRADEVAQVLAACDRARYQPVDRLPSDEDFRATLDTARRAFTSA